MSRWKTVILIVGIVVVVWLLHPPRQMVQEDRGKNVVEIIYMGSGQLNEGRADAVREFEKWSDEEHAKDPSRPIYRVITGQNAARDLGADPTRFLISLAGGTPPDVIRYGRHAIGEWAARGAFTPLNEYIDRDIAEGRKDAIRPEDFYGSCWDETLYKGKVYAVPTDVDVRGLYYNKDLFKRAGLVDERGEPRPPRDWDELKDYAVKLTERDSDGHITVLGFIPHAPPSSWVPSNAHLYLYGWMNGGEFMSDDGTRCTLNSKENIEALAYMAELFDAMGGYAEAMQFAQTFQRQAREPFILGKVGMVLETDYFVRYLARYDRNLDYGVAPPPLPKKELAKGRKAVTWTGGWSYAIPSTARNKDAAWEFLRFMSSERAFRAWHECDRELLESQGRLFVARQVPIIELNRKFQQEYVYTNPMLPENLKQGLRVLEGLMPVARYRPVCPVGQMLLNEQDRATETALYHRLTPAEALDRATRNVQYSLDEALSPAKGHPVKPIWFFVLYGGLLIALVGLAYLWDTRSGFRRRILYALGWRKKSTSGVIEGSHGGYFRRQWVGGLVCASPWIIGFIVFSGGPMLYSLLMSFCDYDILNPPRWIGLFNFTWMFEKDDLFALSLWNTVYMIIGVPLGISVSLAMAILLNAKVRGVAVWRTFFYLPSIVPMVAASIIWIWIFNPSGGLINQGLKMIGIAGPGWLVDTHWSKPALIVMGLWGAGSSMIIWLAGLQGIDQRLYEAADLDGAGAWQKFLHVSVPQLSPYIFFNLVMGLIGTFEIFGQAFIMTNGGPDNSTLFYVYHLFNNAFRYGHMGYASAMAWILFLIILTVTILQLKLSKRWVYYEAE